MNHRIVVNVDVLGNASRSLSSLSNHLSSLSHQLGNLDIDWDSITDILIVRNTVRKYSHSLSQCSDKVSALSAKVQKVASQYIALEELLVQGVTGMFGNDMSSPEGASDTELDEIRESELQVILNMFDNVTPPSKLPSYTTARDLDNNIGYQLAEGIYSFITGDYQNMKQSPEGKASYLIDNILSGCLANDVTLYTPETLLNALTAINVKNDIGSIIADILGVSEAGNALSLAGYITNLTSDALNRLVSQVNQVIILQNLDQNAAMGMAASYAASDDPLIRSVGKTMTNVLDGGLAAQIAFVTGKNIASGVVDAYETTAHAALNYALGQIPGVGIITGVASITSAAMDAAVNAGDYAKQTNNLSYAADAVDATYDNFQADYNAYKQNPSDANLSKAIESYKAYQRSAANSMETFADYSRTATDSAIGQLTSSEKAKQVDEKADYVADLYRDTTHDIDMHHNYYRNPAQLL